MDDATAHALNALNREFYRRHAVEFSARRQRPWKGWTRLLASIPEAPLRVLDVGCGNARFGRFLARHRALDRYVGLDASEPLLDIARADPPPAGRVDWHAVDFTATPPDEALPRGRYDLVVLFGVLHGVAGEANRRRLLEACARRLDDRGLLVFTCWDLKGDARIARRIAAHPTRATGLDPSTLGPADHLVPWGDDGESVRYGHDIDAKERRRLLAGLPVEVLCEFREDGPHRRHNHYTVLRAACGHLT